ncbi:SpoIIE family protein phosphatase [Yinghuangia sp. KLBMP8922]|uniref:protein-serine/threonine phosphatase n=1 Tax=Yinghuangia soli TaxID=2908204 RepID=A0AA41PZA8_9ACTN|nr:SpoIIE family protein phosphatase [Yinghuangia soli]MCF2527217.1 SpoIIE family protein phosphatase [Yinghuangia soli]
MFWLQVAVVLLLSAAAATALVLQAHRDSESKARHQSLGVTEGFAQAPGVAAALESPDPTAVLQPAALRVMERTGVAYVAVFDADGVRVAHTEPGRIGVRLEVPEVLRQQLLQGESVTATVSATAGRSIVSSTPVFAPDGRFVGVVVAGITTDRVGDNVDRQLPLMLGGAAAALALAAGGTALVSRRLQHQTHDLGPAEMTRMYEHHDAVLHAVREGVLIIGADGRLLLANDEARRLLDLPPDNEQSAVQDLPVDPSLAALLASDRVADDEVHPAGDRLLAVNKRTTAPYGGPGGSVVTLRDTTELRALAGHAEVARERLRLLYDAGVRVGTTLDVRRTAEELAGVAVPAFADIATVELLDPVLRGEEPTGTALRRTALHGAPDDHPLRPVGEPFDRAPGTPVAAAVEDGRAVVHTDLAAADGRGHDPEHARRLAASGLHSVVTVPLQAGGVVLGLATFWRGRDAEPFDDEDRVVAEELVARAALSVDNARRYTREHTLAVTLQRSLLPRGLPDQDALEVAYRYLPAQAGVGGDWFDVIPLPGARVALIVGDVVGHGLHAAATMGRLRTAAHNFSALDLPPDELIGHLDDVVARIDQDQDKDDTAAQVTGATCMYAIYDSVIGRITLARAGHPGPAIVQPDGTVVFPDIPGSPPLGLAGNEPIEATELDLPEGSQLVLFTDGLVEHRGSDIDAGFERLRAALAAGGAGRTPEQTCTAVMDAMLPERPSDDIALLVARPRLLPPDHVATWEAASDPQEVARVRTACTATLQAWGLDEIAFDTELILSELITNAIRYAAQPIRVRLLHNDILTCEVSDGSSTSPHLRRAATTDEGGRGLFLVAQFADRWGTRYTARGKVIWAEQALHPERRHDDIDPDALLAQWDEDL